jgi:hypothetical protein
VKVEGDLGIGFVLVVWISRCGGKCVCGGFWGLGGVRGVWGERCELGARKRSGEGDSNADEWRCQGWRVPLQGRRDQPVHEREASSCALLSVHQSCQRREDESVEPHQPRGLLCGNLLTFT